MFAEDALAAARSGDLILLYENEDIPGYEDAKANKRVVPCPPCARAERDGILVYLDDHLRKAPPDKQTTVPAVFDAVVSVWKRAVEALTVTGQAADYQPAKVGPAVAHRLSVRPYDGYLLRPGNSDVTRQYGDSEPGVDTKSMHVRQLKRDLLYLAYYGNRERHIAAKYGGVHVFEASLVGAILAFKFDISFFYGVPTTTDLSQTMVSDEELRRTTLDSFSGPIYFDPKLPDNPIRPIAQQLIYPLADRLRALAAAGPSYDQGLALYEQSKAAELTAKKAAALRDKALAALRAGMYKLPEKAPALDLTTLKTVKAERKVRALAEVIAHPQFEQVPRENPKLDPWVDFTEDLELAVKFDPAPEAKRLAALEQLLAGIEGDELKKKFKAPIERYKLHASAIAGATKEQVQELREIVGGLPETFKPYREALHRYAVVDHATALYIQAILAQVPIGSSSGKIKQPGRKLAYRFPVTIEGEPETRDAYADLVIEACKEGGKFEVPPFIMLERQKNESGYRATEEIGNLATSKDEKTRRVPINGIDWSNWGRHGGAVTKYAYSELFTNSVGRAQERPGYFGPIVHSRGVGGGQVSWPTLMRGVSPDSRAGEVDGYEWIAGIPVPKDGKMPTPEHWTGSKGSCVRAARLLESKFYASKDKDEANAPRNCTYDKVPGGKRFECDKCLERFQLGEKQAPLLAANKKDDSYHCTASASRWPELFGEPLVDDSEAGRTEFPCAWLRAVMRYAGTGPRADGRLFKTAREIVAVGKAARGETSDVEEAEEAPPDAGKKGKKPKPKKPKKKSEVVLAMEQAFERARKQL